MTCVALKSHHGRHWKADASGDLKATSAVIKDWEKFQLAWGQGATLSLKGHDGRYVAAEKSGELRMASTNSDEASTFEVQVHPDGLLSLKSLRTGGFVAAESRGGALRASRGSTGAWEKFLVKDRSQKKRAAGNNDEEGGKPEAAAAAGDCTAFFDAFCQLEAVLLAEENYGRTHNDRTAVAFEKRARARRQQGLAFSFRHFCEEHEYPSAFRGCVSAWDTTAVLTPEEGASQLRDQESEEEAEALADEPRLAWSMILQEGAPAGGSGAGCPLTFAVFGIPAGSAAEADEAAFARLALLCRSPRCVAVGPVGLEFPEPSPAAGSEKHAGLSASGITAEFGAPPTGAYDAGRDPLCIAWLAAGPGLKPEAWMLRHGDRRLKEFEAACADYSRRRLDAQASVAERQVRLALELGLPLVVQLPPQDEAERRTAEVLTACLPAGSDHPILLSGFHGRPKCAAALLKHLPGLLVGFSGLLTHSKLKDALGEVAFDTPLERIALESLGPRFPPAIEGVASARGSYSHPAHVLAVAQELARVKQVPVELVLERAWANTVRLYKLPCRGGPGVDAEGVGPAADPAG